MRDANSLYVRDYCDMTGQHINAHTHTHNQCSYLFIVPKCPPSLSQCKHIPVCTTNIDLISSGAHIARVQCQQQITDCGHREYRHV